MCSSDDEALLSESDVNRLCAGCSLCTWLEKQVAVLSRHLR
jgi:hypothetical protein